MAVDEDRLSSLREELRLANETIVELTRTNEIMLRRFRAARTRERRLRTQITRMRRSFSWRVTFPIRALRRLFARSRS